VARAGGEGIANDGRGLTPGAIGGRVGWIGPPPARTVSFVSISVAPSDGFGPVAAGPLPQPSVFGRGGLAGHVLRPLVSAQTWLTLIYLVSGLPLAFGAFMATVVGIPLGLGLLPLALVGVPIIAITLIVCLCFGAIERWRAALMLGQVIAPPRSVRRPDAGLWAQTRSLLFGATSWRAAAAAFLALPMAVVGFTVAISAWAVALALITLPTYNAALPKGGADLFGTVLHGAPAMVVATVVGIGLGLAAPHISRGLAEAQVWVNRQLLGPTRRSLTARVGALERSRSRMVDAADSERRRIERDLHDGAQARLVSLAMELGRAKARFADDPAAAKALVDQAHEEAKTALVELRSLVRGVHPPVLSDRGLDAALSGLAALCSVPVSVEVAMTERPSASVEAVAYFIVAETLTNVSKHSGARSATVSVHSDGELLHVVVRDDGHGGAVADGPGLAGLADRVHAVDGQLTVSSPVGGPTVIEAELPCAS